MQKDIFDSFIESIEQENTVKVAKSLYSMGQYDYSDISFVELENIILSMKPNSPKSITTICYVMSMFAKYIGNDDMAYMIRSIDRKSLWLRAKTGASKKFISNFDFQRVCHEIDIHEEHNVLYQNSLFRCIYEGIYCDDMGVIKNLRSSDINGNRATIRYNNGNVHELNISASLANDLLRLGENDLWWRNNRYGAFKVSIKGEYKDSCFKIEDRNGSGEYQGRYSYYRILRKISKEYVGYSLLPLQLYVSGIMHRISLLLNDHGYDISDAFANNNKNRTVNKIISDELHRSNYDIEVRNFREMVKGHIDVFIGN